MAGRSRRSLVFVFLVILTCGFLGMVFGRTGAAPANTDNDMVDSVHNFAQVYSVIEQNYAEKLDADKAIYDGAIPGMLRVLDPHSNFFDPKQYSALQEEQRGRYYGVGMQVGPRNNKVIVIAPFAGAPAYRAGIRPGDIIAAIDGKPTDNMTTSDVANQYRVRTLAQRLPFHAQRDVRLCRRRTRFSVHWFCLPGVHGTTCPPVEHRRKAMESTWSRPVHDARSCF